MESLFNKVAGLRHGQIYGTLFSILLFKDIYWFRSFYVFRNQVSDFCTWVNCRFTSELNSINTWFLKLNIFSKTLDRTFTESKNFVHNYWRDTHSNFVDFYGKVLQAALVSTSEKFIFQKKFFDAGFTISTSPPCGIFSCIRFILLSKLLLWRIQVKGPQ